MDAASKNDKLLAISLCFLALLCQVFEILEDFMEPGESFAQIRHRNVFMDLVIQWRVSVRTKKERDEKEVEQRSFYETQEADSQFGNDSLHLRFA